MIKKTRSMRQISASSNTGRVASRTAQKNAQKARENARKKGT